MWCFIDVGYLYDSGNYALIYVLSLCMFCIDIVLVDVCVMEYFM